MEEIINNHLQRMKNLQSVYEERTGQHNILGILINELTEQLRQHNVCDHPDEAIIKDKPTDYCLVCNRNI